MDSSSLRVRQTEVSIKGELTGEFLTRQRKIPTFQGLGYSIPRQKTGRVPERPSLTHLSPNKGFVEETKSLLPSGVGSRDNSVGKTGRGRGDWWSEVGLTSRSKKETKREWRKYRHPRGTPS